MKFACGKITFERGENLFWVKFRYVEDLGAFNFIYFFNLLYSLLKIE